MVSVLCSDGLSAAEQRVPRDFYCWVYGIAIDYVRKTSAMLSFGSGELNWLECWCMDAHLLD